jgi:hypothetical protein
LRDGGEYGYLHPYFERIRQATGIMIVPHEGVTFDPSQLSVVVKILYEALRDVEKEPEQFQAVAGKLKGSDFFKTVERDSFRQDLQELCDLFQRGLREKLFIVGDGE